MPIDNKCYFCDTELHISTSWKTDKGKKRICTKCDGKLDQILKHWGEPKEEEQ